MSAPTTPPYNLFELPGGKQAWIPADVELRNAEAGNVPAEHLHFLIYIPWNDGYLERVPKEYRDFFHYCLPYLHARTTDVHVATCLPFVKELVADGEGEVDEAVVYPAFILHDSGWSQMSQEEIAESLGVTGLALSGAAVNPKIRHVLLGEEIAERALEQYPMQPALTGGQKELIYQAILYHDRPQDLAGKESIPAELRTVCDVDHLWSFTHANFWQDTVRKGVEPGQYVKNLAKDLDGYFVGEAGRRKARRMLQERAEEVKPWEVWAATH